MLDFLKKNWTKSKYIIVSGFSIGLLFLLIIISTNNSHKITKKSETIHNSSQISESKIFKEFLLSQLNSPFVNLDYEIKKGDTIEKILLKLKVKNTEVQKVINEYKKYAKSNKLFVGNKIEIIIEKNLSTNKNSIVKFSSPISKSTTVEIIKDDENKIVSKKIITKLYKKKILSQNIIKNNLYTSAIEADVNPDTIIEFARIFGFEIDFQRDIRKNDYFKIVYEKYFDESGKFIKSGSILYAHMSVNGREISDRKSVV